MSSVVSFFIRELADRGISVEARFPEYKYRLLPEDWETAAGTMLEAIRKMSWIFDWGVAGKVTGHDFLCCNSCEEVMMLPKSKGAPSQKPVCHSTPACKGLYRRLPEIFDVDKPPTPVRHSVKWSFDDGGAIVQVGPSTNNGKTISVTPAGDGDSNLTIRFVATKTKIPYVGQRIVRVTDGKFIWTPISWKVEGEELEDAA